MTSAYSIAQENASDADAQNILERSRTALWRLIDATAKSSSSLNTYPIPDFFGLAAMQRETCAKNFGDTDPNPGAHPPNVPILANRRARTPRTRSVQLRFQIFLEQLQCNVLHFHVREKIKGSYLVAGNPFAASWTFS